MKKILATISLLIIFLSSQGQSPLYINKYLKDTLVGGFWVLYHDTTHTGQFGALGSGSGGGSGSGTVNSGTQYRLAYYATTGTTVSQANAITGSRALVSDANGVPTHSTVTTTELGYVSGVTSGIQTQINNINQRFGDGDISQSGARAFDGNSNTFNLTDLGDWNLEFGTNKGLYVAGSSYVDMIVPGTGGLGDQTFEMFNQLVGNPHMRLDWIRSSGSSGFRIDTFPTDATQSVMYSSLSNSDTSGNFIKVNPSNLRIRGALQLLTYGTGVLKSNASGNITSATIVNADVSASAAIDASKIADGTVSSAEFQFINSVTSNVQNQLDAKSGVVSNTNTVYVDTLGSDATGLVNRPDKPFLTMNAAMAALPSTGGVVQVSVGTFASPDTGSFKSNMYIIGSGKPVPNTVLTYTSYGSLTPNWTQTWPTRLVGGTIFQGTFYVPFRINNITLRDFGVDVGSDYVGGGSAVDGLILPQYFNLAGGQPSADGFHKLQTGTNPRMNINIQDIFVLQKDSTSLVHSFVLENTYQPYVKNVSTIGGFAGQVFKVVGGTVTGSQAYGSGTYGIIIKSNDYSYGADFVLSDFQIGSIGNSFNGAGLFLDNNDPSAPNLVNINISNGIISKTKFGIKSAAAFETIKVINISPSNNTPSA
jgi:hypothetical protein